MAEPIRISIEEPGSGELLESRLLEDDVVVIVHGTAYVHHVQKYANGTQVWTIKGVRATAPEPATDD